MARDAELENVMPPTSLEWTEEARNAMRRVPFFVRKSVVRGIEEFARERGFAVVDAAVVAQARAEREGAARGEGEAAGAARSGAGGAGAAHAAAVAGEGQGGEAGGATGEATAADRGRGEAPAARETERRQLVNFAFYKVEPCWRRLPDVDRERGKEEFLKVVEDYDRPGKLLVLSYSTVGIRADAEFMLWRIGYSLELFNEMTARLNRTGLGKYLTLTYSYLSMTKKSLYEDRLSPEHPGERIRISPGKARYLFVYPFVKKRAWYLLTQWTRQGMMDEHIYIGNKYPSVKLNTTYSFGIDDQEFVVAFESDYPEDFLDLVMELREAQASMYTERDTPIFTCITMPLRQALDALG